MKVQFTIGVVQVLVKLSAGGTPVQLVGELVKVLVCIPLEQVVQVPYVKVHGTTGVVQLL